MYEVGVVAQFEAAHRLHGDFGPATRLHGHTYRLEVIVRGMRLRPDGTLYDLVMLQERVNAIIADLHYRDLADVAWLEGVNTTVENVADQCWEQIAPSLRGQGLDSLLVRVWENPQGYAARDDRLDGLEAVYGKGQHH